jgi:hypothetical protein
MAPFDREGHPLMNALTSALSAFGAAAQPTFQPVVVNVFANDPITIARSAIAG